MTTQGLLRCMIAASILPASLLSAQARPQDRESFKPDRLVTYKAAKKGDLKLHVFQPKNEKKNRVAVVFFFGGGWVGGSPSQFYPQAKHLADRGIVAISAQYRTRKSHGVAPYDCVTDGRDAIRFVKANADKFGIDPARVIAAGGSAGGHVAACTAFYSNKSEEQESADHTPAALVLFNPVIDTSPKGFGHKSLGAKWKSISPVHNTYQKMPPSIVFHGVEDTTVSIENVRDYREAVKSHGGRCELVEYPRMKHAFFNFGRPSYEDTVKRMDGFIDSLWKPTSVSEKQ